jgi:hypothetical protein
VTARLAGAARADGGDFICLDERTMLGGRSYRTNAEGLRQVAQILAAEGATVESVDLPHDRGPGHGLHLMSLISPIAGDLAVVYPPLAPVALMQTLAGPGVGCHPSTPASTTRWGAMYWRSGRGWWDAERQPDSGCVRSLRLYCPAGAASRPAGLARAPAGESALDCHRSAGHAPRPDRDLRPPRSARWSRVRARPHSGEECDSCRHPGLQSQSSGYI